MLKHAKFTSNGSFGTHYVGSKYYKIKIFLYLLGAEMEKVCLSDMLQIKKCLKTLFKVVNELIC